MATVRADRAREGGAAVSCYGLQPSMPRLLPRTFYARECLSVALDLVGQLLCRDSVVLRITEVEAYRHPSDTASHCRMGRTERNAPMWGPPGRAYVYLCYGIHQMLNVVTDAEGQGAAVLIRGCEPVHGQAIVRERRGGLSGPALLTGPGKVGAALALDTSWSHHPLHRRGGLELRAGEAPPALLAGPRVGVDFASEQHRAAPWRIALADSPWVSHRRTLQPLADRERFLRSQRSV